MGSPDTLNNPSPLIAGLPPPEDPVVSEDELAFSVPADSTLIPSKDAVWVSSPLLRRECLCHVLAANPVPFVLGASLIPVVYPSAAVRILPSPLPSPLPHPFLHTLAVSF